MGELKLELPLNSYDEISSIYGWRDDPFTGKRKYHYGIDYEIGIGNMVLASERGKVVKAGQNDPDIKLKLGKVIIIDHTPNAGAKEPHLYTVYGHLRRDDPFNNIKAGDKVKKWQVIGFSGNTGRSYGPHLHFAVAYVSGKQGMPQGDGPTWIAGSEYSDPNKYIGHTHQLNGTIDDLTQEQATRLINDRISYQLVEKFRMAVLVDGRIEGYIDEYNKSVKVILKYDPKDIEKLMVGPMPPPKKSAPLNVDISIKL